MGYQKLQTGRATSMTNLISATENLVNLNDPIATTGGGTATAGTTGTLLEDTGAKFITDGIKAGDVVVNTSSVNSSSRVVAVQSETELIVQTTGLFASGNNYEILSESTEPAVLYVGGAGNIKCVTMGGDIIDLLGVTAGSFIPIQIKGIRVTGTTATNIVALF